MPNFYSSLIINTKNFPGVHQVFRPRYNKEFFKRVTAHTGQLKAHIDTRCKYAQVELSQKHLDDLRSNAQRLIKLKDKLERSIEDDASYHEVLSQVESLEDEIMPIVTKIPNRLSKQVPDQDYVVDEVQSDFMSRQGLSKVLSHRKLSYINNCYSKSVVGPNSHYYFGIGAKLQLAISDYFTSELERESFVPVSGPSLVKSAVVEAVNSSDGKEYFNDPARVLSETHKYTTLHLTEASRESLVGFVSTLGPIKSNNPLRLMTSGAGYKLASEWFDGDAKRITQFETLHALVLNSSIEQYSMKEYARVCDLIWSSYKKLHLPARLVHCSIDSMFQNEYDAHRIDIWLPSRQDWLSVGRVSHYLDYITVRVGMRRGHLIDSCVFDGQVLAAAIIENKQTALGKFIIPEALEEHAIHLTDEERQNYFDSVSRSQVSPLRPPPGVLSSSLSKASVLNNHEQRRYLRKMEHPFGHSRKAGELERHISANRMLKMLISLVLLFGLIMDWEDFWLDYVPESMRAVLYDYIYRPARRVWWYIVWEDDLRPPDVPYRGIDKTKYEKTMYQRRTERAREERYPWKEESLRAASEAAESGQVVNNVDVGNK